MTRASKFDRSFPRLNLSAAKPASYALRIAALTLLATSVSSYAATACKAKLTAADQVVALNQVQNLMGRYAGWSEERGDNSPYLEPLFAMKTEGVSWKIGRGPVGIAEMKARFASLAKNPEPELPGNLHLHSMLTPVIEIAQDGKTAQGVWDSFGPAIHSAESGTTWLWIKYGVDFVKQDGEWKIWHLEVFPVFSTPWNTSPTDNVKAAAAKAAAQADAPPRPPRPVPPETANWAGTKQPTWSYDGKTMFRGPNLPVPTCTYDPAKSSAEYATPGQ